MIDTLLRDLRQPEYIHVLINPLPIYGLAMAWVGLIVSLFLGSRRAQIATLAIVLISAASAWPVYELGQQSYDRVLSMPILMGKPGSMSIRTARRSRSTV